MDEQFLIDQARETMLTSGDVMPMIYLELSGTTIMLALDILSDKQSVPVQCGTLARLGWETCKEHPGQKPISVGFYAEAWRVVGSQENTEAKLRPVSSQKKQEVLSVSYWHRDIAPQGRSHTLAVTRDRKKRVIEVGEAVPSDAISYQLEAFLRGVSDAQKPDEEAFDILHQSLKQGIALLSPEQRQQLLDECRRSGITLPPDLF